jgi:NADPH-dependent curcumin reductase CurA
MIAAEVGVLMTNFFWVRLNNYGVGVVLRSENEYVKVGQHLYGFYGVLSLSMCQYLATETNVFADFAEYQVKEDESQYRVLPENSGLPWSVYVGAAGMPGKTAYMAWKASWIEAYLSMPADLRL